MIGFSETPNGFVYNINIDSGLYSGSGVHGPKRVGYRWTNWSVNPFSGLKAVVVVIGIVDEDASDEVSVGISVVEPMIASVVCSEINCSVVVLDQLVCLVV